MYKNGDAAITRVLELTNKCPKELQEKCFEILLAGYVQFELAGMKPPNEPGKEKTADHKRMQEPTGSQSDLAIPPAAATRFNNTANRVSVTVKQLASLFDFSSDPFSLQPVTLPGKKTADKARQIVLLAAVRSYLAGGSWSADWQEVKSLCVDYTCYDGANHTTNLKQGTKAGIFRAIIPNKPVQLTPTGVKRAEELLKLLAGGSNDGAHQ